MSIIALNDLKKISDIHIRCKFSNTALTTPYFRVTVK